MVTGYPRCGVREIDDFHLAPPPIFPAIFILLHDRMFHVPPTCKQQQNNNNTTPARRQQQHPHQNNTTATTNSTTAAATTTQPSGQSFPR